MKLLKWIFFKGPILVLIIFAIYAAWSYFRPNEISNLITWWNTPKAPKVDSAERPMITRGPNGEEPAVKVITDETKLLVPGEWYSTDARYGNRFVEVSVEADAPILIRRYDDRGKLIMTRLQQPNGDAETYDEKSRKVIKPPGGVRKDISFKNVSRLEIGSEVAGVTVQIRKR